jgi:hypothetical protein
MLFPPVIPRYRRYTDQRAGIHPHHLLLHASPGKSLFIFPDTSGIFPGCMEKISPGQDFFIDYSLRIHIGIGIGFNLLSLTWNITLQ